MPKVIRVRTAACAAVCSVCRAPTRNVARMHAAHGRHIESFVCDACLARVPNARVERQATR